MVESLRTVNSRQIITGTSNADESPLNDNLKLIVFTIAQLNSLSGSSKNSQDKFTPIPWRLCLPVKT